MRQRNVVEAFALLLAPIILAGTKDSYPVKIIDRQNSATSYTYFVPGYSNTTSNVSANCLGNEYNVNCSGSARTTSSQIPARMGSYEVQGATFSLQLPDGRIVVVNCRSKFAVTGDDVDRRSCRTPIVNDIKAEFNGNKAKLKWPVSIDGKKVASETYYVLAVFDKR